MAAAEVSRNSAQMNFPFPVEPELELYCSELQKQRLRLLKLPYARAFLLADIANPLSALNDRL